MNMSWLNNFLKTAGLLTVIATLGIIVSFAIMDNTADRAIEFCKNKTGIAKYNETKSKYLPFRTVNYTHTYRYNCTKINEDGIVYIAGRE